MNKAVFFDRDGIVNASPGPESYVLRWEDFHLLPEFVESLHIALRLGYKAIIVTNQRCVARGMITTQVLEDIHRRLFETLRRDHLLELTDLIYCPHDKAQCDCRKPQPGMLLKMAAKHNLELYLSWMVGDSASDMEAGRQAGCRTILVNATLPASTAEIRLKSMQALPATLEYVL